MALYVIATPIGVSSDLSLRAAETLAHSDIVIGEDYKNTSRLLKSIGASSPVIEILNEHSKPADIDRLANLCATAKVSLVSDCGTPGFCDPGANLVHLCRKRKIAARSVPGPSSLMAFLSICGRRRDQFFFRGFLPAENTVRRREIEALKSRKVATIVLDTPYRLKKLLQEISEILTNAPLILGINLSTDEEAVFEGSAQEILKKLSVEKAEFVLMLDSPPPQRSPRLRQKSK